ncbi:hypothetical protein VNI00_010877 [Paramarasmius palmivorus]|uniref:Uncharacterized protein n=1 Tax=Paramarasmius palmivorus TaxID=297713 RepID=A0AAW0CEZ0_9AGAR
MIFNPHDVGHLGGDPASAPITPKPNPDSVALSFDFTTKLLIGLAVVLGAVSVLWRLKRVDWEGVCKSPACTRPVDVILKTRDGSRFGTHTKNLELYNDSFPSADSVILETEDVPVEEDAATTRLLLLFSHNTERPALELESLNTVLAFARAADKYGNRVAMKACSFAMSKLGKRTPVDALRVLCWKVSHDDLQDVDMLARVSMNLSIPEAVQYMRDYPDIYIKWSQYKESWDDCMKRFDAVLNVGWQSRPGLLRAVQRAFIHQVKSELVPSLEGINKAVRISLHFSQPPMSNEPVNWVSQRASGLKHIVADFPKWHYYR